MFTLLLKRSTLALAFIDSASVKLAVSFFLFIFYFLVGLEFELRAPFLQSGHSIV
jgi:hypothetical protein